MPTGYQLRLRLLLSLLTLLIGAFVLEGCQGVGATSPTTTTTPTASTYQLTVTAPPSGAGTITSSPSGINCPSTCTATFASGTKVTLTAAASGSYTFAGWSGACTGTNTCSVMMTAAESVTPAFKAGYGVAVTTSGSGTVTSSPAGISCPTTCSATFPQNTAITLTATPQTGDYFGGWSGGCSGTGTCSLTLSASANVTASFTGPDALTVTTSGTGTGTVTSSPTGINCTSGSATSCTANFAPNTAVTLTETPAASNQFSGWSGACTGTGTCSLTLTSATNAVTANFAPPGTIASLQHIILFAQENRSLDHYFGAMLPYWQSIGLHQTDGVTFDGLAQFNSGGTTPTVPGCAAGTYGGGCSIDPSDPISSFHLQTSCIENQSPFWNEAHNQWDYSDPTGNNPSILANPPLDGFAFTAAYDAESNGFMDIEGVRAMGYYDSSDLSYYYFLASNFGTSDRWFAPIMSRTQLNRMYIIGATSDGHAYPIGGGGNVTSNTNNPSNGKQIPSTPIFEELQANNITWKIYVDQDGTPCVGMTGSQLSSCLLVNESYLNEFSYEATVLNNPTLLANIVPVSQFATDAAAGTLPSFALIEPASSAGLDEHPSDSDEYAVNVQDGMAFAYNDVINPLMTSPSWSTSALIFTYDEWGGLYDHVPPQPATAPADYTSPTDLVSGDICSASGDLGTGMCDFSWTGFRVPVVVISPFANKNYVSHTVRDTTSVLNFVEERFGLKALTARDASQPSMDEFFNFANPPWLTPPTFASSQLSSGLICDQTPPSGTYAVNGGWGEPPQLSAAVKGSGTITSTPSGITCDSDYTITGSDVCGFVFTSGTQVTLTATPDTGSTFTGWSAGTNTGPCTGAASTCTFTMTQGNAEYVEATFQ
ncbi:MAG: alkaline phosphatase family protein [Candidatus Sulfotelmatobacter sp.]|jgi:phospholipase C